MSFPKALEDNNRKWAKGITDHNPDFFKNLSKQQTPEYLWIGCADSRVPVSQIVGMEPGASSFTGILQML